MVVLLKPEPKVKIPEKMPEKLVIQCDGESDFDVQNVIDHIIVVERVKHESPRDVIEKITQIFAMILCILSAFSSFAGVTSMAKHLYHIVNFHSLSFEVDFQNRVGVIILTMAIAYSTVSYIFYILLLKGLKTRKSTLVLAHLVYGVINITFALVFLIAFSTIKDILFISNRQIIAWTTFYIMCMMAYGLFLYAVWTIYEKYSLSEQRQAEAKRMEPYTLPQKFPRASKSVTPNA